ncbi:hypothetical protein A0H81_02944 [Grifola frondosa]|uniref:Uncharacterized protein n=1 Tax=Grifola frondosa TaxID=5627 RepID=A0A1C7MK75_GRIFR|nr:hypothetical protein A0H81_02944 [Grifola frondosa]
MYMDKTWVHWASAFTVTYGGRPLFASCSEACRTISAENYFRVEIRTGNPRCELPTRGAARDNSRPVLAIRTMCNTPSHFVKATT